ncbi:hypothetical protein TRSA_01610 [Treponema saccharophilum]|nr:hypothetical protein TRSA_01610 [Treponema saccharophilum]
MERALAPPCVAGCAPWWMHDFLIINSRLLALALVSARLSLLHGACARPPLRGWVCALVDARFFLIINSRFLAHALVSARFSLLLGACARPPLRGRVCALVRMRDFFNQLAVFGAHLLQQSQSWNSTISASPRRRYAHRACRRTLAPTKQILELDNLRKPPGEVRAPRVPAHACSNKANLGTRQSPQAPGEVRAPRVPAHACSNKANLRTHKFLQALFMVFKKTLRFYIAMMWYF